MAKKAVKKKATKAATKKKATTKAKKKTKAKPADDADETATKKKKAVKKKKKAKRKSRSKKDEDVRQRLFWCVYNHAMKPVAKYAFNQKKAAEKKARELSEGKQPHFVQKVKEPVEDEPVE